jgi:tetratricopeptide (TPR) repeat protein
MIMHPWDLYHGDGKPKSWTPLIVSTLEKGLKVNQQHPGLNHYYIHAVEGSTTPQRGVISADKLASLVPGASHMVHMPSHIYIRTGNYSKGIEVNQQALKGYAEYLAIDPNVEKAAFLYLNHNIHMMAACAIMNGNYEFARKTSENCAEEVPVEYHSAEGPMAEFAQYISATPVFAYVRYGKWDELLKVKTIADSSIYLKILDAFGRGVAHSKLGRTHDAERELAFISEQMEKHPKLKVRAFNTAYEGADVAKHMLAGIIAEQKKEYPKAEEMLRKAAELEENMVYNEPRDWILPPLPYLGQILLRENKFADAEKIFRKDLSFNPNNCWALKGLHLSLIYQGKKKEAARTAELLTKSLKGSDLKLQNAVF